MELIKNHAKSCDKKSEARPRFVFIYLPNACAAPATFVEVNYDTGRLSCGKATCLQLECNSSLKGAKKFPTKLWTDREFCYL
jgi:hypothetical protein